MDAHLSPALAKGITAEFGEAAHSARDIGLHHAKDKDNFAATRQVAAIARTRNGDFVGMGGRPGPPPRVIHLAWGKVELTIATRNLGLVCEWDVVWALLLTKVCVIVCFVGRS